MTQFTNLETIKQFAMLLFIRVENEFDTFLSDEADHTL